MVGVGGEEGGRIDWQGCGGCGGVMPTHSSTAAAPRTCTVLEPSRMNSAASRPVLTPPSPLSVAPLSGKSRWIICLRGVWVGRQGMMPGWHDGSVRRSGAVQR